MRASEETYKERERRGRMSTRSRIVLALASLLLLSVYFLPIWKIDLNAPQYPEGLGMYIEVNTVRGAQEGNLESINGLNHYIGMKEIHPDSIPELKIMPWLFGALIVLGLGAAAYGRRWGLYAWTGLFVALAIAGMVDFYMWEYDYGHNLDQERAIIKVPGMTYQPPLIGSKQMLNITAVSLPAAGGILAFISLFAGMTLSVLEFRTRKAAVSAGLLLLVAGCSTGPRPIAYGEDVCTHCKMTITDARFGTEAVTEHGKVLAFDSIECLGAHLASAETEFVSLWVTDMLDRELIPAQDAFYAQGEMIQSPMGKNLGAFATAEARNRFRSDDGGCALDWSDVLELGAAGHEHGAHETANAGPEYDL